MNLTVNYSNIDNMENINYTVKDQDDATRAAIFKALSDEVRIQIIRLLRDKGGEAVNGELNCGEIGMYIDIPKSTASYHFKVLREAGLTFTRKESLNRYVRLKKETFDKFLPCFLESL